MVWFDNRSSVSSNSNRRTPRRSTGSVYSSNHSRHSAPSLYPAASSKAYNYGYKDSNKNNNSYYYGNSNNNNGRRSKSPSMSLFSTSSSRRSVKPRMGFVQRVIRSIRKLLRNIHRYARRHPIKTFLVVIVPLVLSGVLQKLLALVGIHLPRSSLGWLAGPKPGEGLFDHIVSVFRAAKMVA